MYGFNKPAAQSAGKTSSRRSAAPQSEDSGEIRGPGSGTSDSIKTAVPVMLISISGKGLERLIK